MSGVSIDASLLRWPATLWLGVALSLGGPAGVVYAYVTDAGVYPPVNESIFLPPGLGQSYIDPAFGSMVTRMSDALRTQNGADTGTLTFIVHEYSTMSPFNRDNSRILILHQSYFALYDGTGRYLKDLPLEIVASSEPRWSRRDTNVVYYHPFYSNQLKRYDTDTDARVLVRTFSEYSTISGLGESDLSADGDHLVLVGDHRDVFVYEISTDTKGPVLDTTGLGNFDDVYITPDNNVLIGWIAVGGGRFQGVELFDRNMKFLRQASRSLGHMDVTRDVNGDEVLVLANAADPQPVCLNGVVRVRLADGSQTCLISLDWSLSFHVSAPDAAGWVIISTFTPKPLSGWVPYANEVLRIKLDGSEVRRLAHHRSRPLDPYWYTPRASVSHDGNRLVYSSNYGLPTILGYPSDYMDVYLMDLSTLAPGPAGSQKSIATRVEQDAAAVTYGCPSPAIWYTHTNVGFSGGSAALATDVGCRATLTFSGTGVRWIGVGDAWSGVARISIDGLLAGSVDTFLTPARIGTVLFSSGALPPGTHTLTIDVTGTQNALSAESWVWVDAFDVVSRVEQDDPAVAYSCPASQSWSTSTNAGLSGGSAQLAMAAGCRAAFTFTGTAATWIGYRDQGAGIALVSIDGAPLAEIDTYASAANAQAVMYTVTGLPSGAHRMTVEPTGRQNPASGGAWIWVDAFEVAR